jgi:hypothetical protein
MATVYPFRQPTNVGRGPSRLLDQSYSALHHPPPSHTFNLKQGLQIEGLESNLTHFEATAREKCLAAIEELPSNKMEDWFLRQLDSQIIPALTRIGFEESFARLLFQTAASGWQGMGPFPNKCTLLHPALIKNLKSVRNEMISKGGSKPNSSWIILPRVYHFLKEEHSAYLLCYLDHLSVEPESEFRRILTRIIIEFVGNFTLKYRSSMLPRCLIDSALFYGYEAMFWNNLRNPPPGFEEDLIFNHCLRWIKLLRTKCADLNDDMIQSIKLMEAYRKKVMLMGDPFHPGDNENTDLSGLLVTLRHGRQGAEASINFLGNWLYSLPRDATGRSLSALLPSALNRLLYIIKIKHQAETPAVQNLLQRFLLGLKESFLSKDLAEPECSTRSPEQFQFVVQRVLGLVNGVTISPV